VIRRAEILTPHITECIGLVAGDMKMLARFILIGRKQMAQHPGDERRGRAMERAEGPHDGRAIEGREHGQRLVVAVAGATRRKLIVWHWSTSPKK
jgi:hypothetical protein